MWQKNINDFDRVVAIGGGHGMGRVLSSLSFLGQRLTGIVTTTDDGGSTGRLRKSQECIAWGDLRNCLNQLVTTPSIGSQLFEHRFTGRGELAGHNLGNLMLLALDNLCVRPLDAIKLISDMLKIESQLLPMSEFPTDLCAHTVCGDQILGEVSIDQLTTPPRALSLNPVVPATREAIDALMQGGGLSTRHAEHIVHFIFEQHFCNQITDVFHGDSRLRLKLKERSGACQHPLERWRRVAAQSWVP